MANLDEQIQLAHRIAEEIVQGIRSAANGKKERDLIKASRNEWMKWFQVVKAKGLDDALKYARQLSKDMAVRPNIQTIHNWFVKSVGGHKAQLLQFSPKDRLLILGYIGWWLRILGAEPYSSGTNSGEAKTALKRRAQKTSPKRERR